LVIGPYQMEVNDDIPNARVTRSEDGLKIGLAV
jgi:hypothetical protein